MSSAAGGTAGRTGRIFSCAEPVVVRIPTLPAGSTAAGVESLPPAAAMLLHQAVAHASPSLVAARRELGRRDGAGSSKRSRRTAEALNAYAIRMAERPTPFGLFAGTALAEICPDGVRPRRLGDRRRVVAAPSAQWLLAFSAALSAEHGVLCRLTVATNNLVTRIGGRFVVERPKTLPRAGLPSFQRASVQADGLTDLILRTSRDGCQVQELVDRVHVCHPDIGQAFLLDLVAILLRESFLLSNVLPTDRSDLLSDLSAMLAGVEAAPERQAALRDLAGLCDHSSSAAAAEGIEAVQAAAQALVRVERPITVDLIWDDAIQVPRSVVNEAERAADLLWSIRQDIDPGVPRLRGYHQRFLDKFGIGRAVPVMELLDPAAGLGVPAFGPSGGLDVPVCINPGREEALARLADGWDGPGWTCDAALTDEVVAELRNRGWADNPPPASIDLYCRLCAEDPAGLSRGEFLLAVCPWADNKPAGSTLGRLSHLFPERRPVGRGRLLGDGSDGAIYAEVCYSPASTGSRYITSDTGWLSHRIPVGLPGRGKNDIPLADLCVCSDGRQPYLYWPQADARVVPLVLDRLAPLARHPVAQFLADVGAAGESPWQQWDWGAARFRPRLPRVRFGRTVLTPAVWRLPRRVVAQARDRQQWLRALDDWRGAWAAPEVLEVQDPPVGVSDTRIPIRLDDPAQLEILRRSCVRAGDRWVTLSEPLGSPRFTGGWLEGPLGRHHTELVFPLLRGRPGRPIRPARPLVRGPAPRYRATGPWVFAKIGCPPDRQGGLLRELAKEGPRITAGLAVSNMFFVRYREPELGHHIRLRYKAESAVSAREVAERVAMWAERLQTVRLAGVTTFAQYDPEVERYGGPAAVGIAEALFGADSDLALLLLARPGSPGRLSGPQIGALALVDVVESFGCQIRHPAWGWPSLSRDERVVVNGLRPEVRRIAAGGAGAWPREAEPRIEQAAQAAVQRRMMLARGLGSMSRRLDARADLPLCPESICRSLAHMHLNRLFGIDQRSERLAMALLRDALEYRNSRLVRGREHNEKWGRPGGWTQAAL